MECCKVLMAIWGRYMIFDKSMEKEYFKFLKSFRKKSIPSNFNQIKLFDELLNDDIDHYISISNRSDGKTFNYIHFILNLAVKFDLKFMLLSRNFTVRNSYISLVDKIIAKSSYLDSSKVVFGSNQFYKTIIYEGVTIGIITDLNEATNLKYYSNFLSDYPIMVYDEFLAIENDYLIDEWERLKTIYSSVNRNFEIPLIKIPKIIYLGNAVNFSSPILANLNLYKILENHPINTMGAYGNVALEMHKNEHVNEMRNLRAFDENNDLMTYGQFKINNFSLASDDDLKLLEKQSSSFNIKLKSNFLKITYNLKLNLILLSITVLADNYTFNYHQVDNKKSSIYLKDTFFSPNHAKKYTKSIYKFENSYSKDFILSDVHLMDLKINRLIGINEAKDKSEDDFDKKEKQVEENYIKSTKKALLQKFTS